MTDEVRLRPVEEDDIALLEALTQDPEKTSEFGYYGWYDVRRYRRRWAEDGLLGLEGGTLMVVVGDEPIGMINWRRRQTTPASFCWTLGIALLPSHHGRGYGTQAHRLLTRYLFAHTTAHRIEADTEVENIAEQRALEKAGFTREGVIRGCAWRAGAWRDGVAYSLLRTDPQV